jgi:uracil-DNA glycosylase family 4
MTYTDKEQAVMEVFSRWEGCVKCELGTLRKQQHEDTGGQKGVMVFGDGNVDADIVVLGIGPGAQEDRCGEPFVGESGGILDEYLEVAQIDRAEIFIMNVVACRPFSHVMDFKFGREREENRDPTPLERTFCRPLWEEILYIIDPLMVVAMGKPTVIEVTGNRSPNMTNATGKIDRCTIKGKATDITYPVMMMYHPAFLARTGDTFKGGPWHQTMVAWKRTTHLVDQLKNLYFGTAIPDRGFGMEDLFVIRGGIPR